MPRFSYGGSVIELVQGDITQADTEAIANAANAMLMGGGGVDGAIHRAAGPDLKEALREIKQSLPGGVLETGGAVLTPGFGLPAKYVIHCVGPIYEREAEEAPKLLKNAYIRALELCEKHGIRSISFPSISTGVYGYPLSEAAPIALGTIKDFLAERRSIELCRFVLFDERTLKAYEHAAERLF